MKKLIAFSLVLIMCLSLCACGKSEAVKNVEAMIDALGEITLESADAISAVEDAYAALTEEEQQKVGNYAAFAAARDRYYVLALPGQWRYCHADIWTALYPDDMNDRFQLNADMTWESYACGYSSGTWSVSSGEVILHDDANDYDYLQLNVHNSDGILCLGYADDISHVREEDFYEYLSDSFLFVDLSEVDPNEYLGFISYAQEDTDEWGDPTGSGGTYALLQNKLYDQGWLYLGTQGDFAIEVLIPEHTASCRHSNGDISTASYEASSATIVSNPFSDCFFALERHSEDYSEAAELTVDQLTLGRAKGTLIFVNAELVTVKIDDEGNNQRVLVWGGECPSEHYVGAWLEGIEY